MRVLDENGRDVPTGEPGLVYMRMGAATFDYYKDREKTLAGRARGMPGPVPGPLPAATGCGRLRPATDHHRMG